jgi:hypothetical protein
MGFDEAQLHQWRQAEKKSWTHPQVAGKLEAGGRLNGHNMEVRLAKEWKARWQEELEITRRWFERRAKAIFEQTSQP